MLFLAPALLVYAALTAYPVLRTFYNSFHAIGDIDAGRFVGLAHFREVLQDATFWSAVRNTAIWALVAPVMDVVTGLLLALCLYAGVPYARFLRVAWFTPVLLSYVVVGILWVWIYNYDWGVVNVALRALGLGQWAQAWRRLKRHQVGLGGLILLVAIFAIAILAPLIAPYSPTDIDLLQQARVEADVGAHRATLVEQQRDIDDNAVRIASSLHLRQDSIHVAGTRDRLALANHVGCEHTQRPRRVLDRLVDGRAPAIAAREVRDADPDGSVLSVNQSDIVRHRSPQFPPRLTGNVARHAGR